MLGPLLSPPEVHSENQLTRHPLRMWSLHHLMLSIAAAHLEPHHLENKTSLPPTSQYLTEVTFGALLKTLPRKTCAR